MWRTKQPKKNGWYIVTKEFCGSRYITIAHWEDTHWLLAGEVEEGIVAWKREPKIYKGGKNE